jgi:hypothetical protein
MKLKYCDNLLGFTDGFSSPLCQTWPCLLKVLISRMRRDRSFLIGRSGDRCGRNRQALRDLWTRARQNRRMSSGGTESSALCTDGPVTDAGGSPPAGPTTTRQCQPHHATRGGGPARPCARISPAGPMHGSLARPALTGGGGAAEADASPAPPALPAA